MSDINVTEAALRRKQGAKWNSYPPNILPAWVADMDFNVAEPIRQALSNQISNSDFGYPLGAKDNGLLSLFRARVKNHFNWDIDESEVLILNDVVQGLYLGVSVFSAENESVLIQTPIYPPFLHAVTELSRLPLLQPLVATDERFEIDFEKIESAIDSSTKIFALCNPHNPTGRAFNLKELTKIGELCCRHDLIILSDEIHADLVYEPKTHVPIASISPEVRARTVTLMSASKAFNIAGLCMAFAHFGSSALKKKFETIPSHVRGGTNALSVAAVRSAWTLCDNWLNDIRTILFKNRNSVSQFVLEKHPKIRYFPPDATYLAWLDLREFEHKPSYQSYLMDSAKVAVSGGEDFGEEGRGFIRVNFATSPEILEKVLARVGSALDLIS
jgi:cystathionine beta-lyase